MQEPFLRHSHQTEEVLAAPTWFIPNEISVFNLQSIIVSWLFWELHRLIWKVYLSQILIIVAILTGFLMFSWIIGDIECLMPLSAHSSHRMFIVSFGCVTKGLFFLPPFRQVWLSWGRLPITTVQRTIICLIYPWWSWVSATFTISIFKIVGINFFELFYFHWLIILDIAMIILILILHTLIHI